MGSGGAYDVLQEHPSSPSAAVGQRQIVARPRRPLPALRRQRRTTIWDVVTLRPGKRPLHALAEALGAMPRGAEAFPTPSRWYRPQRPPSRAASRPRSARPSSCRPNLRLGASKWRSGRTISPNGNSGSPTSAPARPRRCPRRRSRQAGGRNDLNKSLYKSEGWGSLASWPRQDPRCSRSPSLARRRRQIPPDTVGDIAKRATTLPSRGATGVGSGASSRGAKRRGDPGVQDACACRLCGPALRQTALQAAPGSPRFARDDEPRRPSGSSR